MSFLPWFDGRYSEDRDYLDKLEEDEQVRKDLVRNIINDLLTLARTLGQNQTQATTKVEALFLTFAAEWNLYMFAGSTAIITAIQNDATLPWLDTDVAGLTIRQRLVNRLSS